MPGALRWLGWMALTVAACGQIRVVPDGADSENSGADVSADVAGDVNSDVPRSDIAGGCQIDDDCKSLKGKTPCKDPVCDKATGKCKLHARAVGEPCFDLSTERVDCQEDRCDGTGQCAAQAQADGTVCGIGACGNVCKSGACVPATTSDYDDKNPCTNDYCDQGKVVVHEPFTNLGLACDDVDACTHNDACVVGLCRGVTVDCSDGLDCTVDACSGAGGCQHTPKLDACSDGNPCTTDACELAVGCTVVGFDVGTCDDNNACSQPDFCDKGVCKGKPSTDPSCACATDSECVGKTPDLCSLKYKCDTQHGVCAPKPDSAVVCNTSKDGACVKTACDPVLGNCVTLPVAGSPTCDDGNPCTADSHCFAGSCMGSTPVDCADQNPCTVDSCGGDTGCLHAPASGPCEDGNSCTIADTCQDTTCTGSKKPCDDGLLCTFDGCDGNTGDCQHVVENAACDDKNPCTTDICDPATDCGHAFNDTAACDDNNVCTDDNCKSGKCVSVVKCDCTVDLDCNDKNPCTADVCQAGQCVTKAVDGNPCNPGDKCQQVNSGTCSGGSCVSGNAPVDCSSVGDACNAGTCDPASGKCQAVAKPSGTACEDGNGCTQGDVCAGGACLSGAPLVCPAPAGSPCQDATCQSTGAQTHTCVLSDKTVGTPCEDGLFCTVGEACDTSGVCVGTPLLCDAPSDCVIAACEEAQQMCVTSYAGTAQSCDDGLYCTVGDACDGAGGCASGAPRVCAGGTCVTGVCDEPTAQCIGQPTPDCCSGTIGCDDGFPCTVDTCKGSVCAYTSSANCCSPTLWADDFDSSGLQGMTLVNSTGSLALGWQWRAGSVAESGMSALYYGNPAENNFDFGASSGIARTPSMLVPFALFGKATLDFSVWFDTESGNFYDLLTVSAVVVNSTGSPTTTLLWTKPQVLAMGVWQKQSVNLPSALWGHTVRFEFSFNTVDSVANAGKGVYVDDISVQVPCP